MTVSIEATSAVTRVRDGVAIPRYRVDSCNEHRLCPIITVVQSTSHYNNDSELSPSIIRNTGYFLNFVGRGLPESSGLAHAPSRPRARVLLGILTDHRSSDMLKLKKISRSLAARRAAQRGAGGLSPRLPADADAGCARPNPARRAREGDRAASGRRGGAGASGVCRQAHALITPNALSRNRGPVQAHLRFGVQ